MEVLICAGIGLILGIIFDEVVVFTAIGAGIGFTIQALKVVRGTDEVTEDPEIDEIEEEKNKDSLKNNEDNNE